MKRFWLVPVLLLSIAVWAKAGTLDVKFSALWWSPEQMTGLNPDAPPPKNTEVNLTKWDYSDPVGTPNPDVVFVKVNARDLKTKKNARVKLAYRFKVGKMGKKFGAKWQNYIIAEGGKVELIPGQLVKVGEVAIKPTMDELFKKDLWPHELEVAVNLSEESAPTKPLYSGKATLPIQSGD